MTPSTMSPHSAATRALIRAALGQVVDPEVGVNIVDLGLVYDIEPTDDGWRIALTMTSPVLAQALLIGGATVAPFSAVVLLRRQAGLHAALAVRIGGVLMQRFALQRAGAIGSALALLLFVLVTASAVWAARREPRMIPPRR